MVKNQASRKFNAESWKLFNFFCRFVSPHDLKIVLRETKSLFLIPFSLFSLLRGIPVAKIIGKKWFYGMPFHTNKHTLDPRPDSETLVEAVIKSQSTVDKSGFKILDLGTGTGCLICSIVKNLPNATGVGIDKSWRACRVARKNVHALGLDNKIKIVRKKFSSYKSPKDAYHIIVANPPYIPENDKGVNPGAHRDPKMALYGGQDGLKYYREIAEIKCAPKIFLEIGVGQENEIKKIFRGAGWNFISKYKDLSGRVRVLEFYLV